MGLNRDIKALLPEVREKVEKMLYLFNQRGIRAMVNETRRTEQVQKAYFMQGRRPLVEVNAARIAVGLWAITEKENQRPITWTLNSKHIEGKAVDVVPLQPNGSPWWNAPMEVWEQMGKAGEDAGLKWGGRWIQRDLPHFEV